jgi:hypothetical protein
MYEISKPIIRWVVGNCHELGYKVLHESILSFKKIYQKKFYYCICFNSINTSTSLKQCFKEVDLILNQNDFSQSLSYDPHIKKGPHWKLYPPRICENQHEIVLDNDIVIYDKLKEIDDFLSNDDMFITTTAIKRSYSGQFGDIVNKNLNINSGLFGLPPNFNYKEEIEKILQKGSGMWQDHFDEQTIIASIIQNNKFKIIPFNTISSCCGITDFVVGKRGTHFIGINKGYKKWWREFKIKK